MPDEPRCADTRDRDQVKQGCFAKWKFFDEFAKRHCSCRPVRLYSLQGVLDLRRIERVSSFLVDPIHARDASKEMGKTPNVQRRTPNLEFRNRVERRFLVRHWALEVGRSAFSPNLLPQFSPAPSPTAAAPPWSGFSFPRENSYRAMDRFPAR